MKNIIAIVATLIFICLCGNYIHKDICNMDIRPVSIDKYAPYIDEPKASVPDENVICDVECCSTPKFTQDEIDLMARVVMSEASVLNGEAKQAVAAVILNRLYSEWRYYSGLDTIEDVIEGCFSTNDNGNPTPECYAAVYAAIENPDGFPSDLYWFWKSEQLPEDNTFIYCSFGEGSYKTYFFALTDYNGGVY